ncbi:hypothetical protein PT974_07089 [Cladobotryum mycophilum]|uniref:Uncharacterized protein n=1 Tax=Cladobotryum mycophilum TaxID=491253 RepID=A0ABR0SNB2_9HYPO
MKAVLAMLFFAVLGLAASPSGWPILTTALEIIAIAFLMENVMHRVERMANGLAIQ